MWWQNPAIRNPGKLGGAIRDAALHVQNHVKEILRQLRPVSSLDFGLEPAVDDLIAFWSRRHPGIRFERMIADTPGLDRRGQDAAYRVIQESLSNAVRHGKPQTIRVSIADAADEVEICVEDDGGGLGQDMSANVSLGRLGLMGMQERLRDLGGHLTIAEKQGYGVCIRAVLPKVANAGIRMSEILLVDDHAIVRSGIRRLLSGLPALRLSEASTGEEALERVRGTNFQLLILDLNLPGLGGLELLRRLLKTDPRLPVLVFSLHTEAIYATRAMEAGARGFVSKNAAPEELLAAIDTVLAGGTVIERDIASEMAMHEIGENAFLRPLTQRDLEILRLLAEGNNLNQIADALGHRLQDRRQYAQPHQGKAGRQPYRRFDPHCHRAGPDRPDVN